MKSLVVFYSLTGNTKLIAEKIASATGSDIVELIPVKEYKKEGVMKFAWGGFQATMKKEPDLQPINPDILANISTYDVIFLGSPVWAWTLSPPTRTFLKKDLLNVAQNKKLALFMSAGGDGIKAMERFTAEVVSTLGNVVIGSVVFQMPLTYNQEEQVKKAEDWAQSMIQK